MRRVSLLVPQNTELLSLHREPCPYGKHRHGLTLYSSAASCVGARRSVAALTCEPCPFFSLRLVVIFGSQPATAGTLCCEPAETTPPLTDLGPNPDANLVDH